jgi:hypothetical protein
MKTNELQQLPFKILRKRTTSGFETMYFSRAKFQLPLRQNCVTPDLRFDKFGVTINSAIQ